jgi:probable phosphomutase (TIGR03848 family)
MPTVLLIRHGENDFVKKGRLAGRLPGVHLNERGRSQAAAVAEALRRSKLAAVYSSPLDRAFETAQAVAKPHGLRVEKRQALIESDLGDWQGKSIAALRRKREWHMLQENPSRFRFPGGEWIVEQQARLVAEIERICAAHRAKETVAVVGHADPFKLILAYYLGLPLDNFQRIMLNTCSVSSLHIDKGAARVVNINWTVPELRKKPV